MQIPLISTNVNQEISRKNMNKSIKNIIDLKRINISIRIPLYDQFKSMQSAY